MSKKKKKKNQPHKKWTYNEHNSLTSKHKITFDGLKVIDPSSPFEKKKQNLSLLKNYVKRKN